MANVYLVQQDTSHLYGEYLISAVVVADSVKQARQLARQAAEQYSADQGSMLGYYPELIVVHRIGSNGNYGQTGQPSVCCLQKGERDELPAGNYNPKPRRPDWRLRP